MNVMICEIYKGSLAEEFGLKEFDQIIEINGIKPDSAEEAIRLIKNSDRTKPLKLDIIRDEKQITYSIDWKRNRLGVDLVWGEDNRKKIKYYCILIDENGNKVRRFSWGEDEGAVKNRVELKGYKFVSITEKELPSGKFSCPKCGSRYGSNKIATDIFALIAFLANWIAALFAAPRNGECHICGYK